jgi:hypothetical protein
MRRRLRIGGVLIAFGLALHLIEPVSRLECAREAPGPAQCTIRRTFFHVLPYETTKLPSVAALVAEPERQGKVDPQAVTCTGLSLMDGEGDATRFACLRDAEAVGRAQRFFAVGSDERALRIHYSERLVLAVSGGFALAGLLVLLWAGARRRVTPAPAALPAGPGSRSRP